MDNIYKTRLKKTENIFKNLDVDKYVDFNILSNNKWNNSFINNYVKNIYNDDYDNILEKSTILCSLSYFTKDDLKKILKNLNVICSNDFDKSKYYIIHNKEQNNIIVVFRGTNYLSNAIHGLKYYRTNFDFISDEDKIEFIKWRNKNIYKNKYFNNLKIPLKDDIDIEIHKGYYDLSIEILYPLMNDLFNIIKNQKTNIVFLGHSMGIISNIISLLFKIKLSKYELLNNKINNIKIFNITLNSPTIGNKNYNLLKFYYGIDKTIQFYNNQDKFINYGYDKTLYDEKKIRHTGYMLKGIYAEINKKSYINLNYGRYLNKIYKKLKEDNHIINDILFFHSLFKIPNKKKMLYI
jgi:hypothetical protein